MNNDSIKYKLLRTLRPSTNPDELETFAQLSNGRGRVTSEVLNLLRGELRETIKGRVAQQ